MLVPIILHPLQFFKLFCKIMQMLRFIFKLKFLEIHKFLLRFHLFYDILLLTIKMYIFISLYSYFLIDY